MASQPRDLLYKRSGKSLSQIKQGNIAAVFERQTKSRENVIARKRLKMDMLLEDDTDLELENSGQEQNAKVLEAIKWLKKGNKLKAVIKLHKLFATHETNADVFLEHEGLQPLHSCFRSLNVDVLHNAAWCVINLTAATSIHSSSLLGLSPTLLQFLKGADYTMQELCAWALANLAGDNSTNGQVLDSQGCTQALMDLIQSPDPYRNEDKMRSVLFALINLARSNSCGVRHIHEGDVYGTLVNLMKEVPANSTLNFEIGWLANCVFVRSDSLNVCPSLFLEVTRLFRDRLNQMVEGSNPGKACGISQPMDWSCFPFVRGLSNLIGLNAGMSRVMLDDIQTVTSICHLLNHGSDSLKQEVLSLVNNCMADVCSRTLLTLHPRVLSAILSQCHHQRHGELVKQALHSVQSMTRTSHHVDAFLLQNNVLSILLQLVADVVYYHDNNNTEGTMRAEKLSLLRLAIDAMTDLVSSHPTLSRQKLVSDSGHCQVIDETRFRRLITSCESLDVELEHKIRHLLVLLGLP